MEDFQFQPAMWCVVFYWRVPGTVFYHDAKKLGQLDVGLEWEELVKLEGCARVSIVFDRAF